MEDHSHSEEQKFFEAALELVHIAGRLVRDAFEQPAAEVMTKASNTDLVTETDQNVEKLIIEGLSKQFPSHKFIGEETVAGGGKVEWTDAPTWIIDPIDGTTNFVHRIPVIGICVGLSIGRKMRAGIVYNPVSNELFTAQVGKGAFRNGFPLRVSNTKVLSEAVIVLQLGSGRDPLMMTSYIDSFQRLMRDQEVHGCRSIGSAALSMIAVAQGCVDGYAEYGIHAWDVAAAAVIVSEAGGILKDPTGAPFSIMSRKVLCAGTEELATALVATLTHVDFAPEA